MEVSFICRDLKGNLSELVRNTGFEVYTLPPLSDADKTVNNEQFGRLDFSQCEQFFNSSDPIDWIIVDHYRLDHSWEKRARDRSKKIMVIDDLANRSHDCDLLLDQNLFDKLETRYDDLTPAACVKLLGPGYAMLREQFLVIKNKLQKRTGRIKQLSVFLGAADTNSITGKVIDGLELLHRPELKTDIIVGDCNLQAPEIKKRCEALVGCSFHQQVDNMAELMASADLAIGAGGSTTWERCCLGLPTLFIATSDNEIELAQTCGEIEIGRYLGSFREINGLVIKEELDRLFEKPELLRLWGDNASKLVDGLGVEKVCLKICSLAKVPVS